MPITAMKIVGSTRRKGFNASLAETAITASFIAGNMRTAKMKMKAETRNLAKSIHGNRGHSLFNALQLEEHDEL